MKQFKLKQMTQTGVYSTQIQRKQTWQTILVATQYGHGGWNLNKTANKSVPQALIYARTTQSSSADRVVLGCGSLLHVQKTTSEYHKCVCARELFLRDRDTFAFSLIHDVRKSDKNSYNFE